ncbi:hypothetical protein M5K25_013266 [Dendrobium thyrsiflorum]|uniref:Uncharacterized protein n=1 Tax=Dendrobium thyrsiflorum TaxID=117978 RepID=A0ABD0UZA3_DENTH
MDGHFSQELQMCGVWTPSRRSHFYATAFFVGTPVEELGVPRRWRPRRGPSKTIGDRGAYTEDHTTTGAIIPSPVRAPDVAPVPHHIEISQPSYRRASSQQATPSRRSVDARPPLKDLGESTQEPRD